LKRFCFCESKMFFRENSFGFANPKCFSVKTILFWRTKNVFSQNQFVFWTVNVVRAKTILFFEKSNPSPPRPSIRITSPFPGP
jgi:hypothetical protein